MLTIHMTTYRRFGSGLLRRAVESVLAQDFRDYEFVICDDASTDGTADYLAEIAAADPRIRIIRNPRNVNSVAISLGRCLEAAEPARGWVSWMFDDCLLLPGALSRLVGEVERRGVEMLYGITEVVLPSGGVQRIGAESEDEVRRAIERSSVLVPNGGILIRREVFDRIGWYDPNVLLRRSCDWDLFRRIITSGVPFATIPEVVMQEYGALQSDSLRNAFTTTFEIMAKFVRARDAAGLRLDLRNVLSMPVDWVPSADWTKEELGLMRYMFLEYFLSVGDLPRAFRWAQLLEPLLPRESLMAQNLLRTAVEPRGPLQAMAAGAYAGVVLGAYQQHGVAPGRAAS